MNKTIAIVGGGMLLLVLIGVALMVYMAEKQVDQIKPVAEKVKRELSGIHTLRQIGQALYMFRLERNRLPKSMLEMAEYLNTAPRFFWSPADPRPMPEQLDIDTVDEWSSFRINPEVAGKRIAQLSQEHTVMVFYERPENYPDGRPLAVFADGHVAKIDTIPGQ